ncbi:M20 aminoacylase family protein [Nitratireductor sp. GISD-1A_MAKvit]|uniref:M20 aminoacylase family protein n=1 Tax=Nitratireductor sp. GISD-1A_MAKvit TaxID=3234198 RepID=UPI003466B5DC
MGDRLKHELVKEIEKLLPELLEIRHAIHANPETGFEEHETAALVSEKLKAWGLEVEEGIATTGVVASLKGRLPGQRAIGLRCDMDALDIVEKTGLPYASKKRGKMHACGHDGHTAMLLGAAHYLSENPDFGGTVHFIFQPAEEGLGGGRVMVEENLFERFPMDAVYGLHNKPGIPVGQFATRPGAMLAATDSWTVTFQGTGGHGGSGPHLSTDPTMPLGHFIPALQSIIGRSVPALESAVLSIGHIQAGEPGVTNVIPSEAVVCGTARSYDPDVRGLLEKRLNEIATASAQAYGCTALVNYERGYPSLVNHDEQVQIAVEAAADLVGKDQVNDRLTPITAGEDFSYMLQQRPGCFMMLGNGVGQDGKFNNLHTPLYDFNDEIIPLGVAYWVSLVGAELGPQSLERRDAA